MKNTMSGEALYDTEIAPELLRISNRCKELGLAFLAVVEYAPGYRAETRQLTGAAGVGMHFIRLAIQHGENIDGLASGIVRYCDVNKIDTSRSIAAQLILRGRP